MTKAKLPVTLSCLIIMGMFALVHMSAPAHADCGFSYENDVENDCPMKDKNGIDFWSKDKDGNLTVFNKQGAETDCGFTYEDDVRNKCPMKDSDGNPVWSQILGKWYPYAEAIRIKKEAKDWINNTKEEDRRRSEINRKNREQAEKKAKVLAAARAQLKSQILGTLKNLQCKELASGSIEVTTDKFNKCDDFITDLKKLGLRVPWW